MKRKKCFKTILSSILAAAMLVTAAPADGLLTVSAAQVEIEGPEMTSVSEEGDVPEQTAQPEAHGAIVDDGAEGDGENTGGDGDGGNTPGDGEGDSIDISTGYWGPTIDYDSSSENAGAVTVYYYAQNNTGSDNSAIETSSVKVKGSWDTNWGDLIPMQAVKENVSWAYTFPLEKIGLDKNYQYGFTPNKDDAWDVDDCNPNTEGNSMIMRNPNVDTNSDVTLYYYPQHGAYPASVKVKYRTVGSADTYVEEEMGRDAVHTAIYSAVLSGLEDGEYEYVFEVDGSEIQDTNNAAKTGKFSVTSYPAEDPSVVSPKVEGKSVTFSYYGPTVSMVKLMGIADDWSNGMELKKNADTGYWTLSQDFSAGIYKYKFTADGTWINDPLNKNYSDDGNSLLVVPGLADADVNIMRGSSTTLGKLENYSEDGTTQQRTVTYSLAADNETDLSSFVEITKNPDTGDTTLSLKADFPESVNSFKLAAADAADPNNTSVVTVTVVNTQSPVIDGGKVTFNYEDKNKTAKKVQLAGTLTTWSEAEAPEMVYDETAKVWSLSLELSPGKYEYKFIVDAEWKSDPLNAPENPGDNSILVLPGLADGKAEVTRDGKAANLPKELNLYAEGSGESTVKPVTYSLTKETGEAVYKDAIVLTPDAETGITTVSLTEDFPETVQSFTLTAKDGDGHESIVTVDVVDAIYKYTIYYYDTEHLMPTDAALWIWTEGVEGKKFDFEGKETLADGNEWLKANVELSYSSISIIPRACDDWSWQDTERKYLNADKAESTTLYIIYKDGVNKANIYTELPKIVVQEKRYLIVEYTRTTQTDSDWYFYTWNSGYTQFNRFVGTGNTKTATVEVAAGLDSISFCLERTYEEGDTLPPPDAEGNKTEIGDHWGEKDGNDYIVSMPLEQGVVKIKIEEGKGIVGTYPYNIGYELAPKEKKIHFYYRNDEKFKEGSTGGFESVQIEINNTAYDMQWNAQEQRYAYDFENLVPGTYQYRYILKESAASEPEYVLDKFNDVTTEDEKYSVCEYKLFEAEAEATVLNESMDYNDNNVLSVSFKGKDGATVDGIEASYITADLTALGGRETAIDPELMEISIAVKEGTGAGEKTIPVTVVDQFANEYSAEATVTVADRNKGADFDWDEAVIYFAVTDRFFDGNAGNNGVGYDKSEKGGSSYHGGDFAGLTQKLDYLKELGVNTIWITPIVENAMTEGLVDSATGMLAWGYHGYWASNFEKLDSHLGTEEEFKALLDAAHARGMKLMVDVVLNHSGYNQESYFDNILKDAEGNPVRMIRNSSETVEGSDQLAPLSGLPDFLTENAQVRELLVEWQSNWISKYDIDYYRVDTVKHVDATTWAAFKNALTKIDPDFKMIGEWAGGGYGTDTGMLRSGCMDSLLDFDYNDKALDFVTGNISEAESFLAARNAAIDNTATLGAFLGSHDEDGYIYRLINEKGVAADKAANLAKVAASLQITSKGQVVIYYGEEIGMTGANNYPYQENRYDFDWTQANENNATYAHYKKMLAIRNKYSEVLSKGTRKTIESSNEKGVDVFQRSLGGETLTIGLNISDYVAEYKVNGLEPGKMYTDCYGGTRYVADEDGSVTIFIPAAADGGTVVLAAGEFEERFIINQIADQTYTGKNITLSEAKLKVYYGLTELKPGTDYTVKYSNNKAVGTAKVTVTGKGNYQGKETAAFAILPKNISDADVTVDYQKDIMATGKNLKPLTKVTFNGMKLGKKDIKTEYFKLAENGEPTGEALSAVKEVGSYRMVITGLHDTETKKGNFTGTVEKDIKVWEKGSLINMKSTVITVEGGSKTYSTEYTGEEIRPVVGVTKKDSAKTPVGTECYDVRYENNTEVGTAKITITGIPEKGYVGSVTKTFKITGRKLSDEAQIDPEQWQASVVYDIKTGQALQPREDSLLKPKNSETTLTKDKDYTVSYQKNTKPGRATMVFTGKGKYTGTIKKTFNISKITLSTEDAKLSYKVNGEAEYTKKGAKAGVSVSYDDVVLREGVDYKLAYANNKAVTEETTPADKMPYVKIIGTGAFSGTIQNTDPADAVTDTTFRVVKSNLANLDLTAADVVYKNKRGAFMSKPVLTDSDGAKLKNGADYTVKYYVKEAGEEKEKTKQDIVEIGETGDTAIIIVATAKEGGKYYMEGSSCRTEYRLVQKSIAKASVKINAKIYTGRAITLDETDFTKIKVGSENLKMGTHYEIVDGSYTNNIKKGTASVTIRGLGSYGGTKKVTFKITSRTVAWWWNLLN